MWTANDIPDLHGKTAIVTGANSGIGYETALGLAMKNALVVLGCRNVEKGRVAADKIRKKYPEAVIEEIPLDLAELASVRKFADTFIQRHKKLDILGNVAGVMAIPERQETADGFERQFGTNHLGHFLLTGLLLDVIRSTPGARIVTVSSAAHRMGKIDFNNLNAEQAYKRWPVYGMSKLANLLFTYELQRRLEKGENDTIAVASHPGYTATNLQRYTKLFKFLNPILAQKQEIGVLPTLYAAVGADVQGGEYYGPDGFLEQRGYPKKVQSTKESHSVENAKQLWEISEKMTGVHYSF
jgi:NAD(P)-dependent dehydrogenase (short-subunit alcohol dehydrogenase family)